MTIAVTPYRCKTWRVISSRFPPVHIFEDVAPAEDFDALYQLEARTNDRLRNETGNLNLLPREECVFGPGAGYIMAPFTHVNPSGSRMSDGSYGVYYAGRDLLTAIEETKYHRARFLLFTRQKPQEFDMRVIAARINASLHDITGRRKAVPELYHSDDYSAPQAWAKKLRKAGSHGVAYDSVRHEEGLCFAIFRPRALSHCIQSQHLRYFWDGSAISHAVELKEVG